MKTKISDLMDYAEPQVIGLFEKDIASIDSVKEATMKKVKESSAKEFKFRRIPKFGAIAATIAVFMCISVIAYAVVHWNGFARTGNMSKAEKEQLLSDASVGFAGEYEDENGYVHYLDASGKEILVLSSQEAAEHELSVKEEKEATVQSSTAKIDASTMPMMPQSINEVVVDLNGQYEDFALGNGAMVLLHPEGQDGFELSRGDVVTINLDANDICILEFGMFLDGEFYEARVSRTQNHSCFFEIPKDGTYCFSVEYMSAAASTFTNGHLTFN